MASQRLTMDITDINKATEYAPQPSPKFEEHDATMAPSKASGTAQFAFTKAAFVFKDRLDNIRGNKAPVIATVPPLEMKVAKQPTIKIEEVTETMPPARASSEVVRLDRRIRILRVVQHALTSSTSVIIAVLQSLTYIKYEQTKGVPDAWPQHPTLGPTILLLAVALMALLFDICSLLAYLMEGQPIAEKAYRLALKLHHWLTGLKTFAFTIAASVCRAGFSMGGQQDLWGWSCSPQGQAMDVTNAAHVNCTGNTVAWLLALINIAVDLLSVIIQRMMEKKKAAPSSAGGAPNARNDSASAPLLTKYSDLEGLGDDVQVQLKPTAPAPGA